MISQKKNLDLKWRRFKKLKVTVKRGELFKHLFTYAFKND